MAYGKVSGVAAICPDLLKGNSNFSSETNPTDAEVTLFLADVSAQMDVAFASIGFSTPVSGTALLAALDPISEWGAALLAESGVLIESSSWDGAEEESKPTHWKRLYDEAMERLLSFNGMALWILGATKAQAISRLAHVGGVSESERDTYESESDYIQSRFKSGMMEWQKTDWTTV